MTTYTELGLLSIAGSAYVSVTTKLSTQFIQQSNINCEKIDEKKRNSVREKKLKGEKL